MNEAPLYAQPLVWASAIFTIGLCLFILNPRKPGETSRARELQKLADTLILSFSAENRALAEFSRQFTLGSLGVNHRVINILSGYWEDVFLDAYDFYYKAYSQSKQIGHVFVRTESATHHTITAVRITSKKLDLPNFTIRRKRPSNILSFSLFQNPGVRISIGKWFDGNYEVKTKHEAQVRALQRLLNPLRLEILKDKPDIQVEGDGDALLIYRNNQQISVNEIPEFLDYCYKVYEHFVQTTAYD